VDGVVGVCVWLVGVDNPIGCMVWCVEVVRDGNMHTNTVASVC
jgi:hypothetical protein